MFIVISVRICVFIDVFGCLRFIYMLSQEFCVYIFLIACSSKNLCGIAQLDTGYVTVCSTERTKELSGVAWHDMDGRGHYNMVSELQFSTLSLDGPSKLS
jgi:hypothetical protein